MRELKNAIERAMILEDDDMLRPVYLPFSVGSPLSSLTAFEASSGGNVAAGTAAGSAPEVQVVNGKNLPRLSIPEGGTSLEEIERTFVEMAMQQANRNQTQAARLLDISRDALRYKLKKFGLMHSEEEEVSSPPHALDELQNLSAQSSACEIGSDRSFALADCLGLGLCRWCAPQPE